MCVHAVTSVLCKEGTHMWFKSVSKLKNGGILKYRTLTTYITLVFHIPDPRTNTPFSHPGHLGSDLQKGSWEIRIWRLIYMLCSSHTI
jgi:hypothetical protein